MPENKRYYRVPDIVTRIINLEGGCRSRKAVSEQIYRDICKGSLKTQRICERNVVIESEFKRYIGELNEGD